MKHSQTTSGYSGAELTIAGLIHLMSCYITQQRAQGQDCTRLVFAIQNYLKSLADDDAVNPVIRATSEQAVDEWERFVEETSREREQSLLTRMLAPSRRQ